MADNDTREASTSEATTHEPAANGAAAPSSPSAISDTSSPASAPAASAPASAASAAPGDAPSAAPADAPSDARTEAASSGAPADAGDDGGDEGGDEEGGDDAAEGGGPGEAGAAALNPDGTPKKRKRRRRKKKGGASVAGMTTPGGEGTPAEGDAANAEQGGGAPAGGRQQQQQRRPQPPKKDPAQVPFGRYFEGPPGTRRHAFSVGEVVAGRVTRTEFGTILVDLFGKAIAVVDENEPREVQMPPPAPADSTAAQGTAADSTAADNGAADNGAADSAAAATDAAEVNADAGAADPNAAASVDAVAAPKPELAVTDAPPTDLGIVAANASVDTVAAEAAPAEITAVASETPTATETPSAKAERDEHAQHDHDHDDGGGEHEDAGTLAAPFAPDEPPPPLPSIGEIFRGRVGAVAESGHIALVNRLIDTKAARKRIEQAREDRTRVIGLVYGFNRGGFDVLVDGVRSFCPASGMSLGHVDDPVEFVGRKLEFSVPPSKQGTHGLVVSRRAILERESRKHARDRVKTLQIGERVKGVVSQVREFGLFIDIGGGLEGMVHISEMSWDRALKPSEVARVGEEVEAQIIRLPDRKDKKERHERIGLSLKAVAADPWDEHGEAVAEGRVFKGKITRVAEFGAFVEVTPGVEGLLHVSELGTNLQHAKDGAKEGEEIWVLIERTDKKARRLSLSKLSPANAKAIEAGEITADAFKMKAPKAGASLKVVVDRVEQHGVFVQIEGVLGRKGRGYIPNAEMATERGTDHRRKFPVGTKLDAKIIGTDREGGLKLSRKALINDEEKRAVQDYRREASKQGLGTFGDLLRAKLSEKT